MTYREFCDAIAPMAAEMKEDCKDMSVEEFERYKNQVRQKITEENEVGLQFMEKMFVIISPHKEVA